jgi:hypothetical protein
MTEPPAAGGPLDFDADDPHRPDPPREQPSPTPDPPRRAPAPPTPPRRRYGLFLVLAGVVLVVVVTLNTLRTKGPGSTGVPVGHVIPAFAAPLAGAPPTSHDDVDVATKPDQGQAGKVPACQVRRAGILKSCDLVRGAPSVLVFFVTLGSRCTDQLGVVQQVSRTTPGVRYAAVAIAGNRGKAADQARRQGLTFPIAWDSDGVLANLYGMAVCPHITYVLPGGRVDGTTVGSLDAAALASRVATLERHAQARGWRPPAS